MDFPISITGHDVVKQEPEILISHKNPIPTQTIFLSNIDQSVAFPVETLFFFEVSPCQRSLTLDIAERVKKAVADTLLGPYYFMSGRLTFNEETSRLELLCNNAGALFVSAASRLCLKDVGNLSLPNSTFHHFIHRPGLYKTLAETALLTIQVTRFSCGGFSIGFVTNHGILDGKAASDMFENLASICRGEGPKTEIVHNDRTPLRARNPPVIRYPHQEYIKRRNVSSLATSFTAPEKLSPSPLIFCKKYVHKLFYFSPEMISTLKGKARINCSSFEAIVAHIWRARAKACFLNPEENSTVLFAVDIRSKISPTLPDGYAGNAVITAFATAKVAEMLKEPLSYCVEKMKEAIERVTDEYVRSAIDWLEVHKGIPATCNGSFYVSAWWRLSFNELDFGFGKPVHAGPTVSGNDEFVLLNGSSPCNDRGVNVWISLEEESMSRFMPHIQDL